MVQNNTSQTAAERIAQVEGALRLDAVGWQLGGQRRSLTQRMDDLGVPGVSIAVITNGALEWARGYGVTEAGGAHAVTPDTIFQVCSISKHVAMVGALVLAQQSLIELDGDINDYLTSWKLPANNGWQPRITVRQLLGHTAGLSYNWYRGFRRGEPVPTLLQVLNGEPPANTPPVRANLLPGSQFRYSGAHYSVLQQLMIDVSGASFPELMHALVFAPLGMRNSSYDQDYPESRIETTAVGHYIGGEPVHGKWRVLPEMAGAGLWTTPTDLALLACEINRAYAGSGALLRQDLVHEALTPQIAPDFGLGCDLGSPSGKLRFGHGGDNIGYKCQTRAFVGDGPGVVITTNGDDGWQIVQEVMQTVADVYGWPEERPVSTMMQAQDAAGSYELRPGMVVQLFAEGSELRLDLPGQTPIRFVAGEDSVWSCDALSSKLSFEQEDGAITGVKIEQEGSSVGAKRIA